MSARRIAILVGFAAFAGLLAESFFGPAAPRHDDGDYQGLRVAFLGRLLGKGGTGGCTDLDTVRDRDVRRNAALIRNSDLCVGAQGFTENGLEWRFTTIDNPRARGPVWYLPHDNESAAFDAAVYAVARYGGRLVAVDGGEGRNYRGVDPNRHFATTIAEARPCAMRRAAPQYTRFVMDQFDGARHILSMHNNTRGGSVSVNVNNAKTKGFRTSGRYSDPDHMVYIASEGSIEGDRRALATRDRLLGAGLNVVHESVSAGNSDCSLSNHVVLNDNREYFNVEAVHGSSLQKGMVDVLMGVLGYRAVD